jgi:hypothetical protein
MGPTIDTPLESTGQDIIEILITRSTDGISQQTTCGPLAPKPPMFAVVAASRYFAGHFCGTLLSSIGRPADAQNRCGHEQSRDPHDSLAPMMANDFQNLSRCVDDDRRQSDVVRLAVKEKNDPRTTCGR